MRNKTDSFKKKKCLQGAIAVELALVTLVVFIPILFLVTEMSRAMYQYNTLVKSVQDGASFLAKFPANDLRHDAAARNLVIFGGPIGTTTGNRLVPNLTTANVLITRNRVGRVNLVTVSINNFQYTFLIRNIFNANNPNFRFGNISATMAQISS